MMVKLYRMFRTETLYVEYPNKPLFLQCSNSWDYSFPYQGGTGEEKVLRVRVINLFYLSNPRLILIGGFRSWSNGTDCKSVGLCLREFESFTTNTTCSSKIDWVSGSDHLRYGSDPAFAEVAQLIEHQPSKLRVAGLSPVSRSKNRGVIIALLGVVWNN